VVADLLRRTVRVLVRVLVRVVVVRHAGSWCRGFEAGRLVDAGVPAASF
jgi:hypothetical protein